VLRLKCTIIPRSRALAIIVLRHHIMPDQDAPQKSVSQKQMSKAERRELQERQRAAKLAQKQQKQQSAPGALGESAAPSSVKPSKAAPAGHKRAVSGYDAGTTGKQSTQQAEDPASAKSRALRIFSHFGLGLPKTLGQGVKGDVHPAVIRLALLFSEFHICGANARCIATLTAFKTVCAPFSPCSLSKC
jgi:translation initiation factor eIF-2B subunit delta